MRRLIVALVSALVIAAVPSTALMATITIDNVCGGLNGAISAGYTYNDQTLKMTSVTLNNNSNGTASALVQLIDPITQAAVFTQTSGINANQPQIVVSIANLNLQMHMVTGPHGTSLQPPVNIACEITPGR